MERVIRNFDAVILHRVPRTERVFMRLFADHALSIEEIGDIYEMPDECVEEVIRRGLRMYDGLKAEMDK